MKKVAVIHILPIENYPPVLNLMRFLSDTFKVDCITTNTKNYTNFNYENIAVKRIHISSKNSVFRLLGYLKFYFKTLLFLLKTKPKAVIYYETLSALPVWVYKFFNKNVNVFIHYHEYASHKEYSEGMLINKVVHNYIEKRNYNKSHWISQTNTFRKELFCKDHNLGLNKVRVFPNYPPSSWKNNSETKNSEILKVVFVGYSIDPRGNYILELLNWLASQELKIELNFYLVNKTSIPNVLLKSFKNLSITINDAVSYDDLPNVLKNNDIGLILYKPTSENWIYNAPNKLFEYLACGLDVWFPNTMIATKPYENANVYPKIRGLDFENLDTIDFSKLISRSNHQSSFTNFYCETIYEEIKLVLLE